MRLLLGLRTAFAERLKLYGPLRECLLDSSGTSTTETQRLHREERNCDFLCSDVCHLVYLKLSPTLCGLPTNGSSDLPITPIVSAKPPDNGKLCRHCDDPADANRTFKSLSLFRPLRRNNIDAEDSASRPLRTK